MNALVDVVIVGGGPAGMSAALLLGRCLRSVVVCDAGRPRNAAATQFNGFLSRDGSSPADFRNICRRQLKRYPTVTWLETEATEVERHDQGFTATCANGERLEARMVLLATGAVDELPQIDGLLQFYGTSVHSCPFCDGFECKDEALAVTGGSQEAADLALELLQWSADVVLCTNGELVCGEKTREQLEGRGMRMENRRVTRLEGSGAHLEALVFEDGERLCRSALFFSPRQRQHTDLPKILGCKISEIDCIVCDETMRTSVPGVYAAGNMSEGPQMVIFAAAEGARAAVAIHNALLEAELSSKSGSLPSPQRSDR